VTDARPTDPRQLPPGLARREALLELDLPVTLADFTPQERAELLRELAVIRASLRRRR